MAGAGARSASASDRSVATFITSALRANPPYGLTPGDYDEPEVRGRAAEEITLRRMPPPRRRFTKPEALRAIEKSPLRFTHSWDQVKEETRG